MSKLAGLFDFCNNAIEKLTAPSDEKYVEQECKKFGIDYKELSGKVSYRTTQNKDVYKTCEITNARTPHVDKFLAFDQGLWEELANAFRDVEADEITKETRATLGAYGLKTYYTGLGGVMTITDINTPTPTKAIDEELNDYAAKLNEMSDRDLRVLMQKLENHPDVDQDKIEVSPCDVDPSAEDPLASINLHSNKFNQNSLIHTHETIAEAEYLLVTTLYGRRFMERAMLSNPRQILSHSDNAPYQQRLEG